ncbi:orotidine-5'-phosphate decarboxylase [Roseomonas marmotae]|uniref:Orotidine 5'-phosphate decarboxylase n=1 Tax=Roseomonas marmotae TaxID=2768161 RepID=A0ABS3K6E1_9PROT|nr:orotidine-5'-phosphate decarboxylase [Roseomonas marmotae]MBO1073014.1 orotidine-5'-phosphate decarboxylase [Roseomonas marmotae]QTI79339.1 orotidine-5'-phosphate decarboxylase [Roseomonas marmotae]
MNAAPDLSRTSWAKPNRCGIIAALDTPDPAKALGWAAAVAPHVGLVKVGLELFCAAGPAVVRDIARHRPVFLDLKFHDIPNTVAGAVRSVCAEPPAMLTLHGGGGAPMIEAARRAAEETAGARRPAILAVTVLTSFTAAQLAETGVSGGPAQQVLRLARLALSAGADGLVCSPHEVSRLRDAFGDAPLLVVPGVRPAGSDAGDQARVATPEETAAAGADWLVIGRPITASGSPGEAAARIAATL